jgi:hypothetical protein
MVCKKRVGYDIMNWIRVVRDGDKWWAFVNTVMKCLRNLYRIPERFLSCTQIVNDKRKDEARRRPVQTFIGRETGSESGNSTWEWSK